MQALFDQVRAWIGDDPDGRDRAELTALLALAEGGDAPAVADLEDRFAGPLTFGTAGLRGRIGAGPHRMNTAVLTTATAGLCTVLDSQLGQGFTVAVGYDARHRSDAFARTVAAVVVAAGGRALLMPSALPTPLLAFALLRLDADAGVMVTASHNPPADNGYKVYVGRRMSEPGGSGAQIVPPMDTRIFDAIQAVRSAGDVPVAASGWETVADTIVEEYVTEAVRLVADEPRPPLRVALTAMHGVGAQVALHVLSAAGFDDVHLVAEQSAPDPDFPTVSFPNPEEPGALDLAIATATAVDADLVVALDPDADRCSVAIPERASPGGWRQLTGDEVGAALGEQAGRTHAGKASAVLARSIVSSALLARIAAVHGVGSAQTLTGFKWIARAPGIVYGYEEAIGYCVNPAVVRDKDGVTAALKVCELAAALKAAGRGLDDLLADLALEHGLHATSPLTFRVDDLALIGEALGRLQGNPPATLAGAAVLENDDLARGWAGLPPTDGIRLVTDRADRVVVRPSGTEPKLKCYLEVVERVTDRGELPAARQRADSRLEAIKDDLKAALGLS